MVNFEARIPFIESRPWLYWVVVAALVGLLLGSYLSDRRWTTGRESLSNYSRGLQAYFDKAAGK